MVVLSLETYAGPVENIGKKLDEANQTAEATEKKIKP